MSRIWVTYVRPAIFSVGGDATEAFEDVGHSVDAKALMKDFYVGSVSQPKVKK